MKKIVFLILFFVVVFFVNSLDLKASKIVFKYDFSNKLSEITHIGSDNAGGGKFFAGETRIVRVYLVNELLTFNEDDDYITGCVSDNSNVVSVNYSSTDNKTGLLTITAVSGQSNGLSTQAQTKVICRFDNNDGVLKSSTLTVTVHPKDIETNENMTQQTCASSNLGYDETSKTCGVCCYYSKGTAGYNQRAIWITSNKYSSNMCDDYKQYGEVANPSRILKSQCKPGSVGTPEQNESNNGNNTGTESGNKLPELEVNEDGMSCEDLLSNNAKLFVRLFATAVKIAAPILLIVLSAADFMKAIAMQEDDAMVKMWKKFATRAVITVLIMLLPTFINLIGRLFNLYDFCGIW